MAHSNGDSVVNREMENISRVIDQVSVKVPAFIPSDPGLWFLLLEGSFDAAGITQDSIKLGPVLTPLDQKYALKVRDILSRPGRAFVQDAKDRIDKASWCYDGADPGFPEDVLHTL